MRYGVKIQVERRSDDEATSDRLPSRLKIYSCWCFFVVLVQFSKPPFGKPNMELMLN